MSGFLVNQAQAQSALIALAQDQMGRLFEHVQGASSTEGIEAAMRALAGVFREQLQQRYCATQRLDRARLDAGQARRVHYLSMEFLLGRALHNAIAALDCRAPLQDILDGVGLALDDVLEAEHDAALGNGGLGRLAACFLDAFAELKLPSFGYGLRYQFGMFAQRIQQGEQIEVPDDWLRLGSAWEVPRPELRYRVSFGGRVVGEGRAVSQIGAQDSHRRWQPAEQVIAQAYDFIVPAHQHDGVSTLRQWHASADSTIDLARFNQGDYLGAAASRVLADSLNWVLYPDDSTAAGRELRLKQEMLLVSASLQDALARHLHEKAPIEQFGQRNVIHMNDTHPALAPAELMRLLMDEHGLRYDLAWRITRQACSYTNHTLMPEALETWPVELFERLLPRHLEIIYDINIRFLSEVRARFLGDEALIARVSLIDEQHGRRVRMAYLAVVASSKVNGVAALHSDLMTRTIFADFARIDAARFHNVTNGVTHRRWLQQANPALSALLDQTIGSAWRRDPSALATLRLHADQPALQQAFLRVKQAAKQRLADRIRRDLGINIDTDSLFDVQIKRIHEYKRQLLLLLHVIARYLAILQNPDGIDGKPWQSRTVIIAGKAASAYAMAKLIIQLAHDVARVVNSDARTQGKLKLVFVPNYGVSLAELIIPAADLSEQISTAGTEASGTGNMKFAFNGACTIGTWDGANIEMAQAIGEADFFEFGLRADAINALQTAGYDPRQVLHDNFALRQVLSAIASGHFSPEQPARYADLVDGLQHRDRYFLLADFADYLRAQHAVDVLYQQRPKWAATCLRNIAGMGHFSVDRAVQNYIDQVWSVEQALPAAEQV